MSTTRLLFCRRKFRTKRRASELEFELKPKQSLSLLPGVGGRRWRGGSNGLTSSLTGDVRRWPSHPASPPWPRLAASLDSALLTTDVKKL